MRTQAVERRNTNLWPVEGLNHYFTDLKNWLEPKEVELPLVALHHGDHSSDLFGTELWILLKKGPVYKFISFSSQYILFLPIKYSANTLNVLFHGLSGRHQELTGTAPGWKWGCAKSFYVLG